MNGQGQVVPDRQNIQRELNSNNLGGLDVRRGLKPSWQDFKKYFSQKKNLPYSLFLELPDHSYSWMLPIMLLPRTTSFSSKRWALAKFHILIQTPYILYFEMELLETWSLWLLELYLVFLLYA